MLVVRWRDTKGNAPKEQTDTRRISSLAKMQQHSQNVSRETKQDEAQGLKVRSEATVSLHRIYV